MPVEAYEIAINLVADAAKVTGPLDTIIQALRRVQDAQRDTQEGMNGIVSSLSGARRVADSFASAMERAARATREAANAAGRIRVMPVPAGGDGANGPSRSGRPGAAAMPIPVPTGGSYISPYSAAATSVDGVQRMLTGPGQVPLLGYDPMQREVVRGSGVPMYGASGPGVPVGPTIDVTPPRASVMRAPLLLGYDGQASLLGTALATIPGQGNSYGNGANFRASVRPNGYVPDFVMPEDLSDLEELDRIRLEGDRRERIQQRTARQQARFEGGLAAAGRIPDFLPNMPHFHGPNLLEMLGGAAAFELGKSSFESYSHVEQIYNLLNTDSAVRGDPSRMAAIRAGADRQLGKFKVLTPEDVARSATEAYAISGGKMEEQAGIAELLNRLEQNMVLRTPGKSHGDAQRQAVAIVRALDVSNRFYDPKTGQFSMDRASAETDRMQALLAVGSGFTTGQSILSFEKSAKLAGQRLSLQGEAALAHFIEVDPRNSGTRLNSFENLFGGHANRMTKKDKAWWTAHGLYDGRGMLVDNDLLGSDPMAWIAKHMGGFKLQDIDDHTQRMNVSSMVQEARGAQGNIFRQAAATARSSAGAAAGTLLNSPSGKLSTFDAAFERLQTTLGKFEAGPGIRIIDKLTDTLTRLTDYMNKNPQSVDKFMGQVEGVASAIISVTTMLAKAWNDLPGPLKSAAIGAFIGSKVGGSLPVIGKPLGALIGGGSGLLGGLAGDQAERADHGGLPIYTGGGLPAWQPMPQARVQKQAYVEGHDVVPIVHVYLDSEPVAHRVEHRLVRNMGLGVQRGSNDPDLREAPYGVGLRTV